MQVGDIVETCFSFLDGPERAEIVFHHEATTVTLANTAAAIAEWLDHITTGLSSDIGPALADTCSLVAVSAKICAGPTGGSNIFMRYPTVTGTGGTDSIPAQCAVIMAKYTDLNSRRGRGRIFWPFAPAEHFVSGVMLDSNVSSYQDVVDRICSPTPEDAGDNIYQAVVYSRAADAGEPITSVLIRPVLVTQRRRVQHRQPPAAGA